MKLQVLILGALCALVYSQDYIDGEYLVRVNEHLIRTQQQDEAFLALLESDFNVEIKNFWVYNDVKLLHLGAEVQTAERIKQLSEVKYVQQDSYAYSMQECSVQPAAGCWGLDRVDQRGKLDSNDPFNPDATYYHGERQGSSVVAYVTDTGIEITNHEFGGRAIFGYTAAGIGNPGQANDYHGTHVAGTVGSNSYGIAKEVQLSAVKVLNDNGSGPWSASIDGIMWIGNDHRNRSSTEMAKSVVNMSLGGSGENPALEDAINAIIGDGVVVVVSAGNSRGDACNQAPAYIPNCVTVAASDVEDLPASFTNYGSCVDIFAPGVDVLSTSLNNGTTVASGTSMSAPHVAGAVARYMDATNPAPTPAQVDEWLNIQATRDALTLEGNDATSPNKLLYFNC